MRKNRLETQATIDKLMEIARKHFAKKGYAEASLEQIAVESKLTRGALYHHFRSKNGLFRAVLESVQKEVAQRIEQEASQSDDVWEQLSLGCRAFIEASVEQKNKRIMLIDGPAVLGWEGWRELDQKYAMRLLREQLQLIQQQNAIQSNSIQAMTHFLSGALNESALWIAQTTDYQQSLDEAVNILVIMLKGLKK